MITRDHKLIVLECDDCGEVLETGTADFDEARQKWRDEGWTSIRNGKGVWENICARCSPPTEGAEA